MRQTDTTLSESESVHLLRQALIASGMDMGEQGDHWPMVNDTVHKIMQDFEELNTERAVQDEMKKYLYADLKGMEELAKTASAETRAELMPKLAELRALYDALFVAPAPETYRHCETELPPHLRRAAAIIDGPLENIA